MPGFWYASPAFEVLLIAINEKRYESPVLDLQYDLSSFVGRASQHLVS